MDFKSLPQPESEELVPPGELSVDGDNPNTQGDEMFDLLCERIKDRGWIGNAIIADMSGLIADGEHRWRAAQEIGLSEVPVKFLDITDTERRMIRQEMNKISGFHIPERDALEYQELLDSGYSEELTDLTSAAGEDLDELLALLNDKSRSHLEYEYNISHTVYYEDCVGGMKNHLDDDSVDCVVTDPPYGIEYDGKQKGTVANDNLSDALDLLNDVCQELVRVLKDDGHVYMFWTSQFIPEACDILDDYFGIQNICVWQKNKSNILVSQGGRKYGYSWEPIFFLTLDDPRPLNGIPTDNRDLFEYAKVEDFEHPTQKPIGLIDELIYNSTDVSDTVLDPFMGSGTTAVSAIYNRRDYVGFELDADQYRPVIDRRIREAKRTMNED